MKLMMLKLITNSGGDTISGAIDTVGITSIATVLGISIASDTGAIELASSIGGIWGGFDWLAALAATGTITFVVKNIIGARKEYLGAQREKLEIKALEAKEKINSKE